MKISRIELKPYRIKLKEPFIISLGEMTHAENIVVVIHTDNGLSGYGECSPYIRINGENQQTGLVVGKILARHLEGKDPYDLDGCSRLMDDLVFGNSSIKSAFDIALHDIAAQHDEVPLYQFLGGEEKRELITDYTVSFDDIGTMVDQAIRIKQDGFPFIKVKVGGEPDDDIQRIHLIREAIGSEIPLRLDANQGWDQDDAIRILQAVKGCGIQFCEEPIPRWDYTCLRWVQENSPIPIMADESCSDHHDAQRLINLKACDMFNVKLGKSSGIFKAMKILRLAEEHGLILQVGGFLESRLGFTASAHVALASNQVKFCDFDTPLMFSEDPIEGGIAYGPDGVIEFTDTPGMGVRLK